MLSTGAKKKEQIKINSFVTDKKGRKVAAIIDIKELNRIEEMMEDSSDLKAINDRVAEPVEDYEVYSRKRKAHQRV
jgi:hypothetical protein